MPSLIDLTGQHFGRLTVMSRSADGGYGQPRWNWRCSCGGTGSSRGDHLRQGRIVSCGCYHQERAANFTNIVQNLVELRRPTFHPRSFASTPREATASSRAKPPGPEAYRNHVAGTLDWRSFKKA
jgi:hypothetical protein